EPTLAWLRGVQAMYQRRYATAIEIYSSGVAAATKRGEASTGLKLPLGFSQQRAGDVAAARATFEDAVQDLRRDLEKAAPDSQAAAAHTLWPGSDYSGGAATRSDLGSNPQRSSFSRIGRRKEALNLRNFAADVSGGNVYEGAVAYAGTSCLSHHSFSGLSWFKIKGQRKHENSAALCITLCVTRALEDGQSPDDVR